MPMGEVLQANIFFFITSIAVVVCTALVVVVLYHLIKIVASIRRIVDRIDAGSEMIAEDVDQLRSYVLEGSLFSQLIGFFMGQNLRRRRTRKASKAADEH